jgi:hypothetical protein
MPSQELRLQTTLLDFMVEPTAGEAFEVDPVGFGLQRGLSPQHGAALLRFKDRLQIYRDASRAGTQELLEHFLPVTQALLETKAEWDACVSAFIASRSITTPYFRDIIPAFIQWLSVTGWGQDRWPSLLAQAHFEFLEFLVERWPDEPRPQGLAPRASLEALLVLDPATRIVRYDYGVHGATTDQPLAPAVPVSLLAHRDAEGSFHALEVTEATAALLMKGQEVPLGEAISALGLPDPGAALELLQALLEQQALWGFRAP